MCLIASEHEQLRNHLHLYPMAKTPTIYIFEIQLKDAKIPVWRIVELERKSNLHEFAMVIMAAMGWHAAHLYYFKIGEREFEYFSPEDDFDPDLQNENAELSTDVKLYDLKLNVGDTLTFTYDFGDNWEHIVTFRGVTATADKLWGIPCCSAGSMNCPPENIGGIDIYNQLVDYILHKTPITIYPDLMKSMKNYEPYTVHPVRQIAFDKSAKSLGRRF